MIDPAAQKRRTQHCYVSACHKQFDDIPGAVNPARGSQICSRQALTMSQEHQLPCKLPAPYPSVAGLLSLWPLLTAANLEVVDCTAEARDILNGVNVEPDVLDCGNSCESLEDPNILCNGSSMVNPSTLVRALAWKGGPPIGAASQAY